MKISHPLVVLDLETTGTWVEKDKIVEIGLIKLMPDGVRSEYIQRVNPGMPIPPNVTRIIGITDADVKDKPRFKEIANEVLSFLGDADLGGFNILRFDLPLLAREFYEANLTFQWRDRGIYDAQKIYHIHEKRDLMAAYLLYCGKKIENAHSALSDAAAAMDILDAQVGLYGSAENGIESLKDVDYERSSDYFDRERKFCWWNGQLYPTFGKHGKKKHLKDIAKDDRKYLEWMLTKDFDHEVKAMIQKVLEGRFPEPPHPPSRSNEK